MAENNKNEVKILGGKATIYTNKFNVWQFRHWLRNENKYVRKSLRTKVKTYAIEQAEELYFEIRNEQKKGRKYYSISVKEAVTDFVKAQKERVGEGVGMIVIGRYKTIESQMRTFLEYVRKDDKITALDDSTLRRYERNGEVTNYLSWRKAQGISDVTVRNEMTTFNAFMKYCYMDAKVTHVSAFRYPNMPKKGYTADGEKIKRMTFTAEEWQMFYKAMRSYCAKSNKIEEDEYFERQMNRYYFLVAANSGLRSGELRQLQWHNVQTSDDVTNNGSKIRLAKITVEALTTKVRKSRTLYARGGEHFDNWRKVCNEYGKKCEGYVFSKDGKQYARTNQHRHFKRILKMTDIDEHKKKSLVPYSCRHFMITERVKSGCSFNEVAVMCGTSVRQIENTYLHLNEEMMRTTAKRDYIKVDNSYRAI